MHDQRGRRRLSPRREPRPGDKPAVHGLENDAFDLWLRSTLRSAFDQVALEPVPEDLLRLIEEDRAERDRLRRRRQGLPEAD